MNDICGGVRGLGWVGFGLIRYSTRLIFIGLGLSSNRHFYYQIHNLKMTRSNKSKVQIK
jgi:hypothetical protein